MLIVYLPSYRHVNACECVVYRWRIILKQVMHMLHLEKHIKVPLRPPPFAIPIGYNIICCYDVL
jgi:hypothetical protein